MRSFKLVLSINYAWITKEEVLRWRWLYIMCGSLKEKFLNLRFGFRSFVDH